MPAWRRAPELHLSGGERRGCWELDWDVAHSSVPPSVQHAPQRSGGKHDGRAAALRFGLSVSRRQTR